MEFLRKFSPHFIVIIALFQSMGCSPTTTVTNYIETDTYVSSADSTNHADSASLRISKTSSGEERPLFKLPTGKGTIDNNLTDLFSGPLSETPLNPFFILDTILQAIFGCTAPLASSELTSATLVFNVNDSGGQALAGLISLKLLNRPWWQNADWLHAHFFSGLGVWNQPGGDFDTSFTPVTSTVNGSTIVFDVTSYFRGLISSNTVHYGMMLVPVTTLQPVTLAAVQTQVSNTGTGPRVVSTYNCVSPSSLDEGTHQENLIHNTYYLGSLSQKSN